MQFQLFTAASISLSLLCAGPALAQGFKGTAKLATPVAASSAATVEGVDWRCEGDTCLGVSSKRAGLDSLMKECRKVSAAVGPLAAYSSRGRTMSASNVATCNRLAEQARTDNQLAAR